jgi:hypothetical protein
LFDLELALGFASRGFHIFPLYKNPSADRPWSEPKGWNRFQGGLPSDGRTTPEKGEVPATTDKPVISGWANNASVIGYGICAPYHVIFDLDVKNGKKGIEEFSRLKKKYGIPAPALVVKTKTGGLHLYYDREKDFIPARVGKATDITIEGESYPGVDFVANSGYVVGPHGYESSTDWVQGRYLIVRGNPASTELTVCPTKPYRAQIRANVEARVPGTPTSGDELITNEWQSDEDAITAQIANGQVPDRIPAGRRDSLIVKFIGVLKARRLPKDTVKVLCEKFLDNCELVVGESREAFLAGIGLDSKLNRFFAIQGDINDPRVVAREITEIGRPFKLVNQLHGALAFIVTEENPYLTSKVIYTEVKARQELAPYTRPIPDGESKKNVSPVDIILRDSSIPKVHSIGYFPRNQISYVDPADGLERVNMYVPPIIPLGCSKPSGIVTMMEQLAAEICGDMADVYLDFMAHVVQKPWIKLGTAILLISQTHGSGKNTLVQVMKPLIGSKNYMPVSGLAPFVEDKSTVLEANVLVVFNEVSRPANRNAWTDMAKAINKIKTAITENSTQINPKYEKQRVITTYSNFVMLSNDPAPFDIDHGDRRIVVINNDPPKLDQTRFGLLADFAHNEKNGRLSPREYTDCTYELHEYFSARKIQSNLTTGDAPSGSAKAEMLEALLSPPIKALMEYRKAKGPGATAPITTDDKILYIIRNVLGYKDFGARERSRFDIFEPIIDAGIMTRVHQKGNRKSRVVTGLPSLTDREDYPTLGPVHARMPPGKVYIWADAGINAHLYSDPQIRDNAWSDIGELAERNVAGKLDVVKLIKS